MDAREYKDGPVIVLELKGRVDDFNTRVLSDELTTIINTGRFFIAIDLHATNFLSAHCLRAIWKAQRTVERLGGAMVLAAAEGAVLETIHYVGFDQVMRRFYTVEEAIAHLKEHHASPVPGNGTRAGDGRGGWLARLLGGILAAVVVLGWPVVPKARAGTDSYTLEQVLGLAREASPAVRLARFKLQERQSDLKIAESHGLPRFLLTGGYMYQSNPTVLGELVNRELNKVHDPQKSSNIDRLQTRSEVKMDDDVLVAGFGFTQVIYSGGLFEHQLELHTAKAREADSQVEIETLKNDESVRNLFIGLLLTQERMRLLAAGREAAEKRLAAARNAAALRTMSAVQLAQIELQVLDVQSQLVQAEKEEKSLRGLLNIAVGRPLEAALSPVPIDIDPNFTLDTAEHYAEVAVHRHPELRRAAALLDSATAYEKVVQVKKNFVPQALLFGSGEYSQGLGSRERDLTWTLGFGFQMPLFDGGQARAELNQALALGSQARLAYETAEAQLRIEINNVVAEIRKAQLQHEIAQRTLAIARQQRAEADTAVREGQLPAFRLDETNTRELEANLAVIAAKAEFYKWKTHLMVLTGQREW